MNLNFAIIFIRVANKCTCTNGTPSVGTGVGGTSCESNNTEDCSTCKSGFRLTSPAALGLQTCVVNICSCPFGTATLGTGAGGTLCEKHATIDCSACTSGYQLTSPAALGFQTCSIGTIFLYICVA